MRRILPLTLNPDRDDRPAEYAFDPTYDPAMVRAFIEEYTEPGDVVFDPFAGFGTTLIEAERLGRRPLGCEILPDRARLVAERLGDPDAIRCADVRDLTSMELPPIDLCLSSPPYLLGSAKGVDPLTGHRAGTADYARYLRELREIYAAVAARSTPEARIVINVANLAVGDERTTFAWDLAAELRRELPFEHEVVLDWDRPPEWLTQDYCLVFGTGRGLRL